jgi:hypothetical protein
VFSFTALGLLIGLVVYGLGSLMLLHRGYSFSLPAYLFILLVGGIVAGYMEGERWWKIIYVEKAHLKWPRHKLETKLLGLLFLIIFTVAIVILSRNY